MAKPVYLVVNSGGMKEYQKFDKLFSFYPEGVSGLVKDYLKIYADPDYLNLLLYDDIDVEGKDNFVNPEKELLNKVVSLYENNEAYSGDNWYSSCQQDFMIEMVCEEVSRLAWDMVEEHVHVFSNYTCKIEDMKWMGDSLVLKAEKYFSHSWFYPPGPKPSFI
jgi:hypothetical protein